MSISLILLLVILVCIIIYFAPMIVALITGNHRTKVILFNIFLGWTIVMWIICLVWACKKDPDDQE